MYKSFFGFKERPFQLVPNPDYLFLSRSHEEAMAHLTYALSQGDGFVEMTGEVGTGKTTLCRAFLENLEENTEAAYIFNPKLDSVQLLQAINDELGIPSDGDNIKDLIDRLNAFLLQKKAEGKKVILVIDEAQNLSKEVLEQLRLLSNLETTTSKLLQIVLVGQPELGQMLDSPELRQLGQRITLSCHLQPLRFKETREYIRHRLHVAAQKPGIRFTWPALRAIYRFSAGVPRLINIACDRALLTAFGLNQKKITGSIARASIRELASRGDIKRFGLQPGGRGLVLLGLLCASLVLLVFSWPGEMGIGTFFGTTGEKRPPAKVTSKREGIPSTPKKDVTPERAKAPASKEAVAQGEVKVPPAPEPALAEKEKTQTPTEGVAQMSVKSEPPVQETEKDQKASTPGPRIVEDLGGFLAGLSGRTSRSEALAAAMAPWIPEVGINPYLDGLGDDQAFFRLAARQNGLLVHRLEGDLGLVKKLDLPAVLEFRLRRVQEAKYLTLIRMDAEGLILRGGGGDEAVRVQVEQLQPYWSKVSFIPWKDFLDYPGLIPFRAPRESIIALKMLLQEIGFTDIEINPFYDERTREAVKTVQMKHGIRVDGVVGPLTKMVLYKEKDSLKIPRLVEAK